MKVIVEVYESDLKGLEHLISAGKYSSISTFVSIAIHNQLLMEEEELDTPSLESLIQKEEKPTFPLTTKEISLGEVRTIPTPEVEDKFPFWATQNKYLCLKQITQDFSQIVLEEEKIWIRYDVVMNRVLQNAIVTRKNFEKIDTHFHRGRGQKLSTGFPKNDSKSTSRYEKQFIGGIDGKGRKYGLAVEIGFLDVRLNDSRRIEFALTDDGLTFSKVESHIFGKSISDLSPSTPPLSEAEIAFIISVLEKTKSSEIELMIFTLNYIQAGKNRPDDGADITRSYLDKKYPNLSKNKKEGGFSLRESETIRAGVISRMNELNFITIQKYGLKSIYVITDKGDEFIKQRR